jgi:hypothetical protein
VHGSNLGEQVIFTPWVLPADIFSGNRPLYNEYNSGRAGQKQFFKDLSVFGGKMNVQRRSSLALGIVLIVLGGLFLLSRLLPGLELVFGWPWIVIGVGAMLLVIGLLVGAPDMAVPACIVGGIGGILYYQNLTGDWTSWSYMWALIPAFVGVGILVSALLGGRSRSTVREGIRTLLVGIVLFLVFGSFFGAFTWLGAYWPLLLVGAGILILIEGIFKR